MNYDFRRAGVTDIPAIWEVLQQAILRRKLDGSDQWQNGYPNPEVVAEDIEKGVGYVLTDSGSVAGYSAVIFNDEPAYAGIRGRWLTDGEFVVVHRVALAEGYTGKGLGRRIFEFIEAIALGEGIYSVKVDTNFDNAAMLNNLEKLGYTYCGEVTLGGGIRKAFEKRLSPTRTAAGTSNNICP